MYTTPQRYQFLATVAPAVSLTPSAAACTFRCVFNRHRSISRFPRRQPTTASSVTCFRIFRFSLLVEQCIQRRNACVKIPIEAERDRLILQQDHSQIQIWRDTAQRRLGQDHKSLAKRGLEQCTVDRIFQMNGDISAAGLLEMGLHCSHRIFGCPG